MLLKQIKNYEIFRPKCDFTKEVPHSIATFEADISPVFPYLNAELGGFDYDAKNHVLLLRLSAGQGITLQPHEIAIRGARDIEESEALLKWIQRQINEIYERRGEIEPRYTSQANLKAMEILQLLPLTNCKACGYATCMAYAAALREGEIILAACPALWAEKLRQKRENSKLIWRAAAGGPWTHNNEKGSLMQKAVPPIFLVFWGLVLIFVLVAGNPAMAGPRVEIPESTHDFGKVFEDKELTHTFIIKNTGDAPLRIKDIDPDCACTAADYDRIIPPGGQGKVTLTIAPFSVLKQFAKHTKVFFNDPDRSQATLTMSGWGEPTIEIQPHHIVRFEGEAGDELKAQVRFVSHLNIPWEISDLTTNIPQHIEVKLRPEQSGKSYILEVKNKSREVGRYAGKIEMKTNATRRPTLIVRVFGDLRSPSAWRP